MADLMREREVADLLRVTRQTLSRWRAQEQGPPFIEVEGSIRYRRAELDAWLAARTVCGSSPA